MKKRKIVDAFIFSNELDMLEYRLELLYDKVDHFILVESNKTHTGEDKALFFTIHKKRFQKYLDKIIHIIVTDFPRNLSQFEIDNLVAIPEIRNMNWVREHHQRRAISRGIEKLDLDYEDVIFVSDVDEIPDMEKIDDVLNLLPFGPVVCQQRWFIWNTGFEHPEDIWVGSTAFYYSHYIENKDVFQHLRNIRWDNPGVKFSSTVCGWHLSWFGSLDFIKSKIYSFAHAEVASDYFTYERNILKLIKDGLPPEKPTEYTQKLKTVTGGYLPPMLDKLKFYDVNSYPKRYDCVIFNDEIELLLLRLAENYEFIDHFVFVESRYTHTGEYKKFLNFEKHKDLFTNYSDKIIYAALEEFPETPEGMEEPYFRENYQKNSIKMVLEHLEVDDKDYIFLSNVDELYDAQTLDSTIREYEHIEYDYLTIKLRWFYWNFDYQHPDLAWNGSQIIRWDRLKKYDISDIRNNKDLADHVMKNYRGWHLSWFGTLEQKNNKRKYSSYYHTLDGIETLDIEQLVNDGYSVFNQELETTSQWFYYPKNKLLLEDMYNTDQEYINDEILIDLD
jgi:beta-1,4-mannosyl-glycoprotein beta-1,4-N-acetylglucosaminyltransferase